jgi:hypothetical protein
MGDRSIPILRPDGGWPASAMDGADAAITG